jgi:hypothetical protein
LITGCSLFNNTETMMVLLSNNTVRIARLLNPDQFMNGFFQSLNLFDEIDPIIHNHLNSNN